VEAAISKPTGIALQITAADVSAPIPVIQLPVYLKQKVEQPVTRFSIASSSRHDAQPMTSESRKDRCRNERSSSTLKSPQVTAADCGTLCSRRSTAATCRLSNSKRRFYEDRFALWPQPFTERSIKNRLICLISVEIAKMLRKLASRTGVEPVSRREREATWCNSRELSGMDSTLPHFKDSRERLLTFNGPADCHARSRLFR